MRRAFGAYLADESHLRSIGRGLVLFSFQTVDAGGVCAKDFCTVVGTEVCEVVAEALPPAGVGGGYEADGPVGAGEEAVGAEGFDYGVGVGGGGLEGPGGQGVLGD